MSDDITEVAIGTVRTPMGEFGAMIAGSRVCRLTFPGQPVERCHDWRERWLPHSQVASSSAALHDLEMELSSYLRGELREFSIRPLLFGTDFQLRVWNEVSKVAYGKVSNYAQIARNLSNPGSVRAVGMANGANPVPIIVPCHRIIGSDGSLTGYGGGLYLKQRLLALEGVEVGSFRIANLMTLPM